MGVSKISPHIIKYGVLESTNKKARELGPLRAKEGTVIIANSQSAGRGSGARVWHSPPGGLYLSLLLHPKSPNHPADLSLLAGVALVRALQELVPRSKQVSVKWPNDCLIDAKKVGGILCESLGEKYHHLCVIGLGVNVEMSAEELGKIDAGHFPATSLWSEETKVSPEAVTEILLIKMFSLYSLYQKDGFASIRNLWEKNCQFIGKKIELQEFGNGPKSPQASASESPKIVGTCLGIDDLGGLVISQPGGDRKTYYSGRVACFWP